MPAIPFTLRLLPDDIPDEAEVNLGTIANKATNEQFSVSRNGGMIEVKRTRAPKKKGEVS